MDRLLYARRISSDENMTVRNGFRHDAAGADNGIAADGNTFPDEHSPANPDMFCDMHILVDIQHIVILIHDPMPIGRRYLHGIGNESPLPDTDRGSVFDTKTCPGIPTCIDRRRLSDDNRSTFSIKSKSAVSNVAIVCYDNPATTIPDKNTATFQPAIFPQPAIHVSEPASKHKQPVPQLAEERSPNSTGMQQTHETIVNRLFPVAFFKPVLYANLLIRNKDIALNKYGRNKNERQALKHHRKPCFL